MIYVFDASAMWAVLNGEPGAVAVEGFLFEPGAELFAHVVNLCEVFYNTHRDNGEAQAQQHLLDLRTLGIRPRTDMDDTFWQAAGRIKADWRRVSLADCFGVTLAQHLGAQFITSDHHELDPLEKAGFPITFFR